MRVLVTGANGALGSAIVQYFQEQGAEVLRVTQAEPGSLHADLTNREDCIRLAESAGAIDAVVHTVGSFASGSGAEAWKNMLATNLETSYNLFEALLPGMKERGSGALIAIGSRVGVDPVPGLAAYGASKAALVHYVRTLALELKTTGIRANIVLPSTIDTAANRKAMPEADHSRWVSPASIAKVVGWLASPEARDVSGASVPVYGKA